MTGGNYLTIFPDNEKRKMKAFLYELESLEIVKMTKEKLKSTWNEYGWNLTDKGKNLVNSDKIFQKLWKEKNIQEFHNYIKNLLNFNL